MNEELLRQKNENQRNTIRGLTDEVHKLRTRIDALLDALVLTTKKPTDSHVNDEDEG